MTEPDGTKRSLRVLTVMVVNRRSSVRRRFQDVTFAFQVRLAVRCEAGLHPRANMRGFGSADLDAALADLHYRDVCEYAVGVNTSAGWRADPDGVVRAAATDYLPAAEVERVEPNENIADVEFGMEALAELARTAPDDLARALEGLPAAYEAWIAATERRGAEHLWRAAAGDGAALRRCRARREPPDRGGHRAARERSACAPRVPRDERGGCARRSPARRPATAAILPRQKAPKWRPFQLAFILLNLPGLQDRLHADREVVDLLFFPTGGGKTEAYLGLAAWTIAHRRITNGGKLGAGVAVLMRYTLRLLTLDQLSRAAGVICALELMRGEPAWREGERHLLGDWPIEIGLWVGSAASPNRLGKTGDTDAGHRGRPRAALPSGRPRGAGADQGLPLVRDALRRATASAACRATHAPQNMEIRCANPRCAFTGQPPLPVLTVDEAIYRRLPAFMIATVDKFAGLPWIAEAGAFFGHVDREDEWGFYGAAEPGGRTEAVRRRATAAAGAHHPGRAAPHQRPARHGGGALRGGARPAGDARRGIGQRVRPKIVASTATVRRAGAQIKALVRPIDGRRSSRRPGLTGATLSSP